jgi:hypothetical protein
VVIGASLAYLLLLFAVAWYGDWRSARSLHHRNPDHALSLGVLHRLTYFAVGRRSAVWFLPIYPATLPWCWLMVLAR